MPCRTWLNLAQNVRLFPYSLPDRPLIQPHTLSLCLLRAAHAAYFLVLSLSPLVRFPSHPIQPLIGREIRRCAVGCDTGTHHWGGQCHSTHHTAAPHVASSARVMASNAPSDGITRDTHHRHGAHDSGCDTVKEECDTARVRIRELEEENHLLAERATAAGMCTHHPVHGTALCTPPSPAERGEADATVPGRGAG